MRYVVIERAPGESEGERREYASRTASFHRAAAMMGEAARVRRSAVIEVLDTERDQVILRTTVYDKDGQ